MALVVADPNAAKPNRCSNPSRKVRIIGKIRNLTYRESESLTQDSKPWITIKNPEENVSSGKCKVFFETQSTSRKDGYELDYCYGQLEEIDQIYSREIQPLVLELFEGRNSSVIALGSKGSGKTYTIQGSQEKPGLAVVAMSEIIAKAKELGKSVFVSLYELTQEHVKDLLNPDHPTIKGLSKVPVNSIIEFHDIYVNRGSSHNTQKVAIDQSHHKGLMVHISDHKMKSNKINFVDLAGYSREGITVVENNRKNRSLYALLNVVSALNDNEQWVPYWESKLTRLLQDSLGGRSHVLLLTCLNPCFCQDSLSSISLVCRSIQQVLKDTTNRSQSSTKVKVHPSSGSVKTMPASLSAKKQIGHSRILPSFGSGKTMSASLSANKQSGHIRAVSTTKDSRSSKGRDFFDEFKKVNSKKFYTCECCRLHNPTILMETDSKLYELDGTLGTISDAKVQFEAASTYEENKTLYKKGDGSPPHSERIREIRNNLKSICESTPLTIKMPEEIAIPYNNQVSYNDYLEPKNPAMEPNSARYCSPQGTFSSYSSKLKHSLVKDYLTFFNSANKEELKSLKGIGEKRATYIMEMREESPEPFKSLDDLQAIGISAKQVKGMMKQVGGGHFEQII